MLRGQRAEAITREIRNEQRNLVLEICYNMSIHVCRCNVSRSSITQHIVITAITYKNSAASHGPYTTQDLSHDRGNNF